MKDNIVVKEKQVEKLEHSSVRLSVTVDAAEVSNQYEEIIKKYSKDIQIKGFRKGKVPRPVIEAKFGEPLRAEATAEVIDKSLAEAFESLDEKPLGFKQPELADDPIIAVGEDFTYQVTYDVLPEFELAGTDKMEVEVPKVKILKKDIDAEMKKIQEQNALVIDHKGKVADGHIVTVDYKEVDQEGNAVEGTERESFTFTVGSKANMYQIDEDVIGMTKGADKTVDKEYPEDFDDENLAGRKLRLFVKVNEIKKRDLPKLDDELAQDVSDDFETLDDLKEDIKKKLEDKKDEVLKGKKLEQIFAVLLEANEIDLPLSMVDAQAENLWQQNLQRFRMNEAQFLKVVGQAKEDMMAGWKDDVEKDLKRQLIMTKVRETEKIEVSDEDLKAEALRQGKMANQSEEESLKLLENPQFKDYCKDTNY